MLIEIKRLVRTIEKELSDADWQGDTKLAEQLRARLDMLRYKLKIGETHEVDF